jgi:hypothetical protein
MQQNSLKIFVECSACKKSKTLEINSFEDITAAIQLEGFIKVSYNPAATVWYCSHECAFNSDVSKRLEKYWRKDSLWDFLKGIFE